MGHKHEWCNEPPMEPTIYFNKSFDERYGDEEDEASNSFLTSPEELQRLRLLLEKNPDFEASSSWPQLVEWCSSCTQTRMVRLVLPEVEKEVPELEAEEEKTTVEESYEPVADEVDHEHVVGEEGSPQPDLETMAGGCEPAAGVKPRRRRGGQGSRRRRLLAFQLMLTEKRGLPMSRLLSSKKTEASSYREEMLREQEESASPALRRRRTSSTCTTWRRRRGRGVDLLWRLRLAAQSLLRRGAPVLVSHCRHLISFHKFLEFHPSPIFSLHSPNHLFLLHSGAA